MLLLKRPAATCIPDADAELRLLSPLNAYGEPKLRLVWGRDRLRFIAGVFTDRAPNGDLIRTVYDQRWVCKYQKADRWYMEVWEPPEFFGSPDTWHAQLLTYEGSRSFIELGEYPSRGDYRPVTIFEHQETGEMVVPTAALVRRVFSRLGIATEDDVRKEQNAIEDAEAQEIHSTVDDMFGDPFPNGGRTSNVTPTSLMQKLKEVEKRGKADEGYN